MNSSEVLELVPFQFHRRTDVPVQVLNSFPVSRFMFLMNHPHIFNESNVILYLDNNSTFVFVYAGASVMLIRKVILMKAVLIKCLFQMRPIILSRCVFLFICTIETHALSTFPHTKNHG